MKLKINAKETPEGIFKEDSKVVTDDFFKGCTKKCFVTISKHITEKNDCRRERKSKKKILRITEGFPKGILIGKQTALQFSNKIPGLFRKDLLK